MGRHADRGDRWNRSRDGTARWESGEELTPTRVVAYVDVDDRHQQAYGIVHGGVWASVVESVGSHGAAFAAREITGSMAVVGISNSTDFLRPHRTGRVKATGTPIFTGRTQQLWLVEIEREPDGKVVARGQLRVQNLAAPPDQRG